MNSGWAVSVAVLAAASVLSRPAMSVQVRDLSDTDDFFPPSARRVVTERGDSVLRGFYSSRLLVGALLHPSRNDLVSDGAATFQRLKLALYLGRYQATVRLAALQELDSVVPERVRARLQLARYLSAETDTSADRVVLTVDADRVEGRSDCLGVGFMMESGFVDRGERTLSRVAVLTNRCAPPAYSLGADIVWARLGNGGSLNHGVELVYAPSSSDRYTISLMQLSLRTPLGLGNAALRVAVSPHIRIAGGPANRHWLEGALFVDVPLLYGSGAR